MIKTPDELKKHAQAHMEFAEKVVTHFSDAMETLKLPPSQEGIETVVGGLYCLGSIPMATMPDAERALALFRHIDFIKHLASLDVSDDMLAVMLLAATATHLSCMALKGKLEPWVEHIEYDRKVNEKLKEYLAKEIRS